MISPFLYKMGCAGVSCLVTLPLDITQTTILSNQKYNFNIKELNGILFASLLFSLQNTFYESTKFLNNKILQGSLSGLMISPIYILMEINKFNIRYNKFPILNFSNKINNFIGIIIIRKITMYVFLYNVLLSKNYYVNIIGTIIANIYGTTLRLYSLKLGYPFIRLSFSKYFYIIDILKSSISDYIVFKLLYNIKISPLYLKYN